MNFVCPVCTDSFGGATEVVSTPCGHCYHRACIQKWLEISSTCPSCMSAVKKCELLKLFFEFDQDCLNLDEILNTNDILTQDLEKEKANVAEIEEKLRQIEITVKQQDEEIILLKQRLEKMKQNQKVVSDDAGTAAVKSPAGEESGSDENSINLSSNGACNDDVIELFSSSGSDDTWS